jgi:hypothetical protein
MRRGLVYHAKGSRGFVRVGVGYLTLLGSLAGWYATERGRVGGWGDSFGFLRVQGSRHGQERGRGELNEGSRGWVWCKRPAGGW